MRLFTVYWKYFKVIHYKLIFSLLCCLPDFYPFAVFTICHHRMLWLQSNSVKVSNIVSNPRWAHYVQGIPLSRIHDADFLFVYTYFWFIKYSNLEIIVLIIKKTLLNYSRNYSINYYSVNNNYDTKGVENLCFNYIHNTLCKFY